MEGEDLLTLILLVDGVDHLKFIDGDGVAADGWDDLNARHPKSIELSRDVRITPGTDPIVALAAAEGKTFVIQPVIELCAVVGERVVADEEGVHPPFAYVLLLRGSGLISRVFYDTGSLQIRSHKEQKSSPIVRWGCCRYPALSIKL